MVPDSDNIDLMTEDVQSTYSCMNTSSTAQYATGNRFHLGMVKECQFIRLLRLDF